MMIDECGDVCVMFCEDVLSDEATLSGEVGASGRASVRIRRFVDVVLYDDGEVRFVFEF